MTNPTIEGYTHTMRQSITSKKGVTINEGEKVHVQFDVTSKTTGEVKDSYFSLTTDDGRRVISGRPSRIGIKQPSMNRLEAWSNDGICKSVFGRTVEPDGHDDLGAPSWLLFLGMI